MKTKQDQWNAKLYDDSHSFVSMYGESMIQLLAPRPGERILDVGCGTGDLASTLSNDSIEVIGIDKSENMIKQARDKYPHLSFFPCDATDMDFSNEFDAVFSNAALHWIKPPEKALSCMYKSLKKNGRFVAEFGGKGNVQSLTDAFFKLLIQYGYEENLQYNPWYFPSISEYTTLMEDAGFTVKLAQLFERPTPLTGEDGIKKWMTMFATDLFTGIDEAIKTEMLNKLEDKLRDNLYKDGNWILDYRRIRVIGVKESL